MEQVLSVFCDESGDGYGDDLSERLARELGEFIRNNLPYFQSYHRVIVYYDRGQKEVSKLLRAIFSSNLSQVEFRTVQPKDYRLFQVADLACTLELLRRKTAEKRLSASERAFFDSERSLRKTTLSSWTSWSPARNYRRHLRLQLAQNFGQPSSARGRRRSPQRSLQFLSILRKQDRRFFETVARTRSKM